MFSRERLDDEAPRPPAGGLSLPIRLLLAVLHAGSWMTDRPLPRMRKPMLLFMRMLDAAAALRIKNKSQWQDWSIPSRGEGEIPVRIYTPLPYQGQGSFRSFFIFTEEASPLETIRSGIVITGLGLRSPGASYCRSAIGLRQSIGTLLA